MKREERTWEKKRVWKSRWKVQGLATSAGTLYTLCRSSNQIRDLTWPPSLPRPQQQPKFTATSEAQDHFKKSDVPKSELIARDSYEQGNTLKGQSSQNLFYHGNDDAIRKAKDTFSRRPGVQGRMIERECKLSFPEGRWETTSSRNNKEQARRGYPGL